MNILLLHGSVKQELWWRSQPRAISIGIVIGMMTPQHSRDLFNTHFLVLHF